MSSLCQKELLGFKCESTKSPKLTRNRGNIEFIREVTYTLIALRFWVNMWGQSFLDP